MPERPCPYCGEYLCEECEAAILGPSADEEASDDYEEEHDPECPCDDCREARIDVQMLFDLGELP